MLVLSFALIISISPATAKGVGAYNVEDGDGWVTATARCSCGVSSYNYGVGTFQDYCPGCKHHNCLYFEQGAYYGYNRGTSPEGLWACKYCDRDYCAKCGKIHDNSGYWLIRTSKPAPEPKPPVVQPKPKIATTNLLWTTYSIPHSTLQKVNQNLFTEVWT